MYFVGIDIGGTKTAISLADNTGKVVETILNQTAQSSDFTETKKRIFNSIDTLLGKHDLSYKNLSAIGLSCPGTLDLPQGKIAFVATTGWENIPVVNLFIEKYGCPVSLENDAASAAYAEAVIGAGVGFRTVIYVTVSTGIGCGICIDGEIYSGEGGNAGELGHICVEPSGIPCPCGAKGCLQLYASGTAIADHVAEAVKKQPSILSGKDIISAYDVEMAVRQNDPVATSAWNKAIEKLGIAIGIVYQLFNPGVFVFGGGVSNAWDLMKDKLYMSVKNYVYASEFCKVILKKAEFGKGAGTLGAILLAKKRLMNGKIFRGTL